jgi:hypothetical protein
MAQRVLLRADKPSSGRPLIQTTDDQHGPQAVRRVPDISSSALGASGQLTRRHLVPSASHLLQLQRTHGNRYVQRLIAQARGPEPAREQSANPTGLPDALKSGIEQLSGLSMEDVRVQYNSAAPARFDALAYTQGATIYMAAGQERHVPHEAWHVVQQAQGRVRPTGHVAGVALNDKHDLEHEAEVMGKKALTAVETVPAQPDATLHSTALPSQTPLQQQPVMQRLTGFEVELHEPVYQS